MANFKIYRTPGASYDTWVAVTNAIEGFPCLAISKIGTILCAYTCSSATPGQYDIKMMRSTDNGQTYSSPAVIISNVSNVAPTLFCEMAGQIFIEFVKMNSDPSPVEAVFQRRSLDEGNSFAVGTEIEIGAVE